MKRSTRPRTTRSSAAANDSTRNISPNDIQTVQNLIERCLQLYMTRKDVVNTLQVQAKIEPDFTLLVWQKLEEQNPEFFKAYYTRLKVKDQMELFNTLLEYQAQLLHSETRATNASQSQYPTSGGLDSTWPQRSGDAQAMHMALHPGMPGFNPSIYAGLPPQGSQMSGDFNLYGQAGMMPGAGGGGMMATTSDPAGSGLLAGAGPGSSPMGGGLLGGGLNSSSMNDFSLLESKPDSDHLHSRMASNSESSGPSELSGIPLDDMLLSHLPPRSISLTNLSEFAVLPGADGTDPLAVFSSELDASATQAPAREMSNASNSGAMGGLPRNFSLSDMALAFDN